MAELSLSYQCVDCQTVYQAHPGVCGTCWGSEIVQMGAVNPETAEENVAANASPLPSQFIECTRSDCTQPVPIGQTHCDYCGEPVIISQQTTSESSFEMTSTSVVNLVAPDGTLVPLHEGVPVVFGRNPAISPWARLAEGSLKVSGEHAEVVFSQGILHVRDLSSLNGTWVRGIRIEGAAAVEIEDGIRIGLSQHLELVVRVA